MEEQPTIEESLKSTLNQQTAKIQWRDLERFYASGAVICVDKALDLIHVASQFSSDNKLAVEQWLSAGSVAKVTDEQASEWHRQSAQLWAVVIAPWVLVQEVKAPES